MSDEAAPVTGTGDTGRDRGGREGETSWHLFDRDLQPVGISPTEFAQRSRNHKRGAGADGLDCPREAPTRDWHGAAGGRVRDLAVKRNRRFGETGPVYPLGKREGQE